MILAEPPRTAYDLNFELFGFPIRIHPFFWLVGFVLGFQVNSDGLTILTWMLVFAFSILIHELGHALWMRKYGRESHIVLYAMGGLAIEGRDSPSPWSSFSSSGFGRRGRTPWEQIAISFAGPAAGFILAALVVVGVIASGGTVGISLGEYYVPTFDVTLRGALADNRNLWLLVQFLLYVNVLWGLMNLLPIFPLDGGQIAQQLLVVNDPMEGMVRSLWLSVIVGAAVAVVGAIVFQSLLVALLFGSLALSNYFTLQQLGGGGRPW